MRRWISIGRIATALALALGGGGHAGAVTEPPPDPVRLGLYEWMAVVPTVVAGEIIGDDGKLVVAVATTPIKGDIGKGAAIKIDLREANRDRDPGTPRARSRNKARSSRSSAACAAPRSFPPKGAPRRSTRC